MSVVNSGDEESGSFEGEEDGEDTVRARRALKDRGRAMLI
jgi:hypothetical protein